MITITRVLQAFKIYPAQAYQLQCKGAVPVRRRGEVTLSFVEGLAEHFTRTRGSIPPEAEEILAEMRRREQPEKVVRMAKGGRRS